MPMTLPQGPNQRWSLDFVSHTLTDGRRCPCPGVAHPDDGPRYGSSTSCLSRMAPMSRLLCRTRTTVSSPGRTR